MAVGSGGVSPSGVGSSRVSGAGSQPDRRTDHCFLFAGRGTAKANCIAPGERPGISAAPALPPQLDAT
jgi:hypothetical protein